MREFCSAASGGKTGKKKKLKKGKNQEGRKREGNNQGGTKPYKERKKI